MGREARRVDRPRFAREYSHFLFPAYDEHRSKHVTLSTVDSVYD